MSEPSPEAKQAVQEAMAELGRIGNRRTIKEILESLYDTATAKARCDGCVDAERECARLREELRIANREIAEWRHAHELRQQLAHQQPSVDFWPPDETRYPGYGSDFRAKPSAPTADVEKIARNVRIKITEFFAFRTPSFVEAPIRGSEEEWLDKELANTLAQARAPLVKALKDIAWGGNRPVDELRSIACVTLTETEISRVKEGEENNKVKRR